MKVSWDNAIDTEMHFAQIIQAQAEHGWLVDTKRIEELIYQLEVDMLAITDDIEPRLPWCPMGKGELKVVTPPKVQFLKSGQPSKVAYTFFDNIIHDGGYWIGTKVVHDRQHMVKLPHNVPLRNDRPMLLKDNAHIKQYLMDKGWKPTWWNENKEGDRTSPKTKKDGQLCPNLDSLDDDVAVAVVKYMSMRHRKAMLEGFTRITREDGRIPSECDTVGTSTFRVAHRKIANLPNTESFYGKEIRSCFITPYGTALVSTDSDSCQMRMLAHYLISVGEDIEHPYIQAILYGTKELDNDAHCIARDLAGLDTRSQGKTFNYALLFGQGDKAMGEKLGLNVTEVKAMKAQFFKNVPALQRILRELSSALERKGYFVGLDGRPVKCSSEHKALNYLLQSAEAIYMKIVNCYMDSRITKQGVDAHQVCFYHDEVTHEVATPDISTVVKIQESSMIDAGKWLNINVPMTGTAAVGRSWAEVH